MTPAFNNVTFGTTTGNATWSTVLDLDIDGNLTVTRGTLARAGKNISVAGNLSTGANGFWTGLGTTTLDGSVARTWSDQNTTLQNVGYLVVDGTNKIVTLADITVYSHWTNNNVFLARGGEVIFAATTSARFIDVDGDAFYDLTFNGVNGVWSFTEPTLTINNDLRIATGTLNMPIATTTLAGSFNASGGAFAHSNSVINFTSTGPETITASGTAFTNPFHNLHFSGSGSWTMLDLNATSSGNINITAGTFTFPSGILAIGGSLTDTGGAFVGNGGTVQVSGNAGHLG